MGYCIRIYRFALERSTTVYLRVTGSGLEVDGGTLMQRTFTDEGAKHTAAGVPKFIGYKVRAASSGS